MEMTIKVALLVVTLCLRQSAAQDAEDLVTQQNSETELEYTDTWVSAGEDEIFEVDDVGDLQKLESSSGLKPNYRADTLDYVNGDPSADQARHEPLDTAVIALYSIITAVGLAANAVVFFVIFAGNEIGKTVTAIYVLQLSIADTIFLFTLPVFSMQKVNNTWMFGEAVCAFSQTIKFFNYYAGIFFLMAMSIDRYIAVAYSTRLSQIRTKERTCWICAGVWLAAILMSIPLMLFARLDKMEDDKVAICRVMFPGYQTMEPEILYLVYGSASGQNGSESRVGEADFEDEGLTEYHLGSGSARDDREVEKFKCVISDQPRSYVVWLLIDFFFAFVVPFSVIVAMYVLILTHLKAAEDKIGHTATSRAARMRKRVTKMVAALVICFAVCWLPHHLFMLVKIRGFESTVLQCHATEEFFVALAFSNSALNPLLYTFMGNNFGERFRKSVRNTQIAVKRRTSSRSSWHRKSTNSHSNHSNPKRFSIPVVHYRRSLSNGSAKEGSSQNSKLKRCQISLLGSKRDKSECDINSMDGSQKAENFDAVTSTMLEHTMETKI